MLLYIVAAATLAITPTSTCAFHPQTEFTLEIALLFDLVIFWGIFEQPRSLNLRDISNERLVGRLYYLMEDDPVCFAVKHQRAGVSVERDSAADSPEAAIRLHLCRVSEISARETSMNLLRRCSRIWLSATLSAWIYN